MKTKPIHVTQLNTNCSNTVCHTMLNTFINKSDVILVTEPWWDDIGNDQKGSMALGTWTLILSAARIPVDKRLRVMAYVKKRQNFGVTLWSDLIKDLDIQIIDIIQANYSTVTIVNIYSQPKNRNYISQEENTSQRLQQINLLTERPVIISGDIKGKETVMSHTYATPNPTQTPNSIYLHPLPQLPSQHAPG